MHSSEHVRDAEKVAVLVPAAGQGHRLGGQPKQFRPLGGRPLLVQVLRLFDQHPAVGPLVVAVPQGDRQGVEGRLREEGLAEATVVPGGESRQASVRRALQAVPDPVEVVLVHDAARPFVSAAQVEAVVQAVRADGAAALAVPVADTLRRGDDRTFGATVPRDNLYRMQTPQGFRRDWLEAAHRDAEAHEATATDDVELVQRRGHDVRPVPGSRRNFKITTPSDWRLAQQLWTVWGNDPERTRLSSSDTA